MWLKINRILVLVIFSKLQILGFSFAKIDNVKIALSSSPTQLNPLFSTDSNSQNINRLLHISLIEVGPNLEIECRLCSDFEEINTINNKGEKIYKVRMKIKDNFKFWNGQLVTINDVIESWKYFTSEEDQFKSPFRFAFQKILNISKIPNTTNEILIEYQQYEPDHLVNLTLLKIVRLEKNRIENSAKEFNFVGSGPYKISNEDSSEILLVPNEYYPSDTFENKAEKFQIKFKFIKDETTLALKLINGEIDLSLSEISPRKLEFLLKDKKLKKWSRVGSNVQYIGINHKNPTLQILEVRKALHLLTPRKELLQYKLKETGVLSHSIMSPAFKSIFIDNSLDEYDPNLASLMLDKLGLLPKKHNDGFYRFKINWRVNSNRSSIELAENIAHFWQKAQIKVNFIIQEWGTFYRGFKNGDYDVVSASWVGIAGPEMLRSTFHSDNFTPNGNNRGFYKNKLVDDILDSALKSASTFKRDDLYKKAQVELQKDLPYIFLWHPNITWIGKNCYEIPNLYSNGSFMALLNLRKSSNC